MSAIVSLGRVLDGAVLSVFVMMISGLALHAFGNFHYLVAVQEKARFGVASMMMSRAFPFKNDRFEFNLMHILLFSILTSIMSLSHHRYTERKAREAEAKDKEAKNKRD
jgi:uncharacterized membrane protein